MSIEVKDLHFSYGKREVLKGIDFRIEDGCLINLLGPNGVGKSTLFRCILGLNPKYTGQVLINGKDCRNLSIREMAKEIAYIPQTHATAFDYDVLDIVLMSTTASTQVLRNPRDEELQRAYDSLEKVGVSDLAQRTFSQISGGEQQMVLIARALAQNARAIIMDEPTSALDYGNTVRVLSCVRKLAQEGYTIFQSTHVPDHAFLYSDKTMVLNEGKILAYGDPREIVTSELIGKIYKIDVEVNSLYDDRVRVCVPLDEIR